jgi:hypothetical protein
MTWKRSVSVIAVLMTAMLLGGCPTSPVGMGIKAGEVNKLSVELAMDEVIRLNCAGATEQELALLKSQGKECVPRITKANYDRAAEAYGKYELAQRGYADALIAWTRVKSVESDKKMQTALAQSREQLANVVAIVCAFKAQSSKLADLCAGMGS